MPLPFHAQATATTAARSFVERALQRGSGIRAASDFGKSKFKGRREDPVGSLSSSFVVCFQINHFAFQFQNSPGVAHAASGGSLLLNPCVFFAILKPKNH
jgi:hypothetical protein